MSITQRFWPFGLTNGGKVSYGFNCMVGEGSGPAKNGLAMGSAYLWPGWWMASELVTEFSVPKCQCNAGRLLSVREIETVTGDCPP